MSFGSPTPVDVAVTGPSLADDRAFAAKLRGRAGDDPVACATCSTASRSTIRRSGIEVDRERAGLAGVTAEEVARSVVTATSSSRFMVPNYWPDPKSGIGYQVQVEIPYQAMDSIERIETVPIAEPGADRPAPAPRRGRDPAGDDAGRIRPLQHEAVGEPDGQHRRRGPGPRRRPGRAGHPTRRRRRPRGPRSTSAGRSGPMEEILRGLGVGLLMSIVGHPAVAHGQLPVGPAGAGGGLDGAGGDRRRGAHALADRHDAQPPVVHGVDHGHRRGGGQRDPAGHVRRGASPRARGPTRSVAAVEGARGRLRPILMTSCAMIAGMLPMALGWRRGGRADRPAGPGRHRRPGRRDPRHPHRAPGHLRDRPGPAPTASRPRSTPTTPRARTTTRTSIDADAPRPRSSVNRGESPRSTHERTTDEDWILDDRSLLAAIGRWSRLNPSVSCIASSDASLRPLW